MSFSRTLDDYFEISKRGSNVQTEIRAGITSFLTIAYILLVNPQIMSQAGVPSSDIVVATALSSAIGTLLVGVVGNLPFGLAPGMGLSAYLVYGLVLGNVLTVKEALTSCLVAGLLLGAFAVSGVSKLLMRLVPRSVKLAIVVGMGILVAMIGMVSVKLVVANDKTLVALGDLTDLPLLVALGGLVLIGSLVFHNVKGGILIGITFLTCFMWYLDGQMPASFVEMPHLQMGVSDFIDLSTLSDADALQRMAPAIAAFVFIGIFDVSGVMFGLAALGDLMHSDGSIPGSLWSFLGSSLGTIIGAAMGCTPIIVTVECAAGIKEGGRTGLTSVTIGILFLFSVFLAPLFGSVPPAATAPVLILVGTMMMAESKHIDWGDMGAAIPAFLTVVMMPLTYSITNGIVFGMVSALAFYVTTGQLFTDVRALFDNRRDVLQTISTGEVSPLLSHRNGGSPPPLGGSGIVVNGRPTSPTSLFPSSEPVVRRPSFLLNATRVSDGKKIDAAESRGNSVHPLTKITQV